MKPGLARRTDPDTSRDAANSIDVTILERVVYEAFCRYTGGCIADDIVQALPYMRAHTIIPRFAPLLRKGLLVDTGERRRSISGRYQRVMEAVRPPKKAL